MRHSFTQSQKLSASHQHGCEKGQMASRCELMSNSGLTQRPGPHLTRKTMMTIGCSMRLATYTKQSGTLMWHTQNVANKIPLAWIWACWIFSSCGYINILLGRFESWLRTRYDNILLGCRIFMGKLEVLLLGHWTPTLFGVLDGQGGAVCALAMRLSLLATMDWECLIPWGAAGVSMVSLWRCVGRKAWAMGTSTRVPHLASYAWAHDGIIPS